MKTKSALLRLVICSSLFFTGNFAFAQCSVNAGIDQTIYLGYAPFSCVTLTASATGTAPFSYAWSNGSTGQSVLICNSITDSLWVQVTDSAGCISTDTVIVYVVDVRCGNNNSKVLVCHIPPGNPANAHTICISPNAVPAHLQHGCMLGSCPLPPPPPPAPCIVNLGNDTSFCSGAPYTLNAGPGFLSYLWSDSSSGQSLTITQSGLYWVHVSDSVNNCVAGDSISITVFNSPIAAVVADSSRDSLGCLNVTGSFTGGTSPFSFSWSNGDTTLVSYVCDSLTTTYLFTVVDSNGCSSTAAVTVPDTLPMASPAHGNGSISIQPNPVFNNTTIIVTVPVKGKIALDVFNLTGARVAHLFSGDINESLTYELNCPAKDLIDGIYFIRLTKPDGSTTNSKMVLMRD